VNASAAPTNSMIAEMVQCQHANMQTMPANKHRLSFFWHYGFRDEFSRQ
jgi:hypothetical protein